MPMRQFPCKQKKEKNNENQKIYSIDDQFDYGAFDDVDCSICSHPD